MGRAFWLSWLAAAVGAVTSCVTVAAGIYVTGLSLPTVLLVALGAAVTLPWLAVQVRLWDRWT